MAKRTQLYKVLPWDGGLNTAVDSGVINDNDLVTANNIVFKTSGARIKREGFEYLDPDIPAPSSKASSGTTRTLYFEGTDKLIVSSNNKLSVGETITISGDSDYNTTAATVESIVNITGDDYYITYTAGSSVSESKTATSAITVVKDYSIKSIHDYWYLNSSTVKTQLKLYASDEMNLYRLDGSDNKAIINGQEEAFTVQFPAAATLTTSQYFTFERENGGTKYYVWADKNGDGTTDDPAVAARTGVAADISGATTASDVATAFQTAIDALAGITCTVNTDTITVTYDNSGDVTTRAANVDLASTTLTLTEEGATNPSTAPSKVYMNTFNNRAIISFSGIGNLPIKYNPEDDSKYQMLGGSPPEFEFSHTYLGRLWTNDKNNPERLHYSATGDHESWNGTSDSGALDIGVNDGDTEGITAIFSFKNILFVCKRESIYRVTGFTPESFRVERVTSGLGCVSHAAAVHADANDVIFMSDRGFHSIIATDKYGDTESAFLSIKIQSTFNDWPRTTLDNTQGTYIPELNSCAWSITASGSNTTEIYLYNIERKEWYRWPSVTAIALTRTDDSGVKKITFGDGSARISRANRGTYTDYTSTIIDYRVKTGTIYPDGNQKSRKEFKSVGFMFKPRGRYRFIAKIAIDNFPAQNVIFEDTTSGDLLGTDFILGESALSVAGVLQTFTKSILGHGLGCTIELLNSETSDQVEIYGYVIEYKPEGDRLQPSDNDSTEES